MNALVCALLVVACVAGLLALVALVACTVETRRARRWPRRTAAERDTHARLERVIYQHLVRRLS